MSEAMRRRMASGTWYSYYEDGLDEMRATARSACYAHNMADPSIRIPLGMAPELRALFANVDENVLIEGQFHCSYGINTSLGTAVYINTGCILFDSAEITLGDGTMLGSGVQLMTADHSREPGARRMGIERAMPITIGEDVWIGAGAIVLPGVRIGAGAIIGAGAVIRHDVEACATVAGVPGRAL
ncbi:MAG: maltose O-acetyltransferase [Halocynthiibacter sp.]|jgi:maltose O-acetyltransferase